MPIDTLHFLVDNLRVDTPITLRSGFWVSDKALAEGYVLCGDNLTILEAFQKNSQFSQKVTLVYLDPPFGTGRDFGAYSDRWAGGRTELAQALRARVEKIHTLLTPNGSILMHVDHRIAPLVALMLDEIFGPGDREPQRSTPQPGFRNEIIWSYGLGGSSPRCYPRKHDTIFWYTKGSDWIFKPPMTKAKSMRMRGQLKKQTDVWEVPAINNMANERVGYPTQKPIALLKPLIEAHSLPGDLVLDPFCGSGTTLVAAVSLQRRALGIDQSEQAVEIAKQRLLLLNKEMQTDSAALGT